MRKKQNAITLIALVITIIILLILAGVAIVGITGENGLFKRSKQAKEQTEYTSAKEIVNMKLMEIQTECTVNEKEYNIKEIALSMKESTEITIEKCYNKETASLKQGLDLDSNLASLSAIVVSVDQYSKYKFLIGETCSIEGVLEGEIKETTAKAEFEESTKFEQSLTGQSQIKLAYKIKKQSTVETNAVEILVTVSCNSGIKQIEMPDGGAITLFGQKEYKIDYTVKIGREYKFKITSSSGDVEEEVIFVEPEITTTEPIISTSTSATSSTAANSVTKGTAVYIKFTATINVDDGVCTIDKTIPYQVSANGTYTFLVTGTYDDNKTITKEVIVKVTQYESAIGVVQYDAGDWTEDEIKELQNKKLYDINIAKQANTTYKLNDENGLNLTFGGFTYKGDTENATYIDNGTIITSRNQSVAPESGYGTPKYDGWQILESEERNGKTYRLCQD